MKFYFKTLFIVRFLSCTCRSVLRTCVTFPSVKSTSRYNCIHLIGAFNTVLPTWKRLLYLGLTNTNDSDFLMPTGATIHPTTVRVTLYMCNWFNFSQIGITADKDVDFEASIVSFPLQVECLQEHEEPHIWVSFTTRPAEIILQTRKRCFSFLTFFSVQRKDNEL